MHSPHPARSSALGSGRRAWTARAGLAGLAAIGLALTGAAPTAEALATTSAGAHAAAKTASADGHCLTSPEARVRAGAAQGEDPNSVTPAQQAAMERKLSNAAVKMRVRGTALRTDENITVNTYVHVITRADGTGGVTRKQVRDQIQVLNDGYSGATVPGGVDTHFRFNLAGLDYTANDDWYDWNWLDGTDDTAAKQALHVGNFKDLNVYVTSFDPEGLLGYATFPKSVPRKRDGVVVLNDSLPGGAAAPYNQGDTLTHEVGHWLNLYHTFQGGCRYPGDAVTDTPFQDDGQNIFFCNESDDTCPAPGLDPVHNFMSYGDDPCLDQFTAGQADRMYLSWLVLRSK